MSDPVTNLAIEDVLSSIRRLVSEGDNAGRPDLLQQHSPTPGVAKAVSIPQNSPQATETAGKFVLSPAFRVAENRAYAPSTAAPAEPTAMDPNPTLSFLRPPARPADSRSALELRIAELEAAVTDQAGDWEPDGSEDVPVVDWSSPEVGESLIFASRAMPQPDRRGVLDLGQIGTRIHPVIGEQELDAAPAASAAPVYDPGEDLDLSADAAATEGARFDPSDYAEDPDPAALLDEDALRKMVVEIVREELQGPMGERITRNVRKMVRREIYRILSSQEFES